MGSIGGGADFISFEARSSSSTQSLVIGLLLLFVVRREDLKGGVADRLRVDRKKTGSGRRNVTKEDLAAEEGT